MGDERPQNEVQLEDEGIPDHEGPLPSKVRSGDQQDGIVPPGTDPIAVDRFGTTAAEQARGPDLADRLEEELPDEPGPGTVLDDPGQLTAPGDAEPDDEPTLIATELEEAPAEPPEEDAIHVVDEDDVPGGVDRPTDGYEETG